MGASNRVVVVADESVTAEALAWPDRFTPVLVASVEAALAEVDAGGPVECVVTDHDPPAVDAVAVVEGVAERDPEIPVVVATENGSEDLACAVVAAGAAQYVPHAPGNGADRVVTLVF